VAGGVIDHYRQAHQVYRHPVGEFLHVVGFGEREAAEQLLARPQREPLRRIAEQMPVGGMNVSGHVLGAADRRHRPDVVEVAVGEQDRGGLEPVGREYLVDPRLGVLTGVDDHAFLARPGCHKITIGGE
jgi:hypothetical protein